MKQLSLFEDLSVKAVAGTHWKLHVDGASRNNPGPSGAGVYITNDGVPVIKNGYFLGVKTNNQAEYMALLLGIFHLQTLVAQPDTVLVVSDSQLLIRQVQGMYKVKHPDLKPLHSAVLKSTHDMNVEFVHVLREENKTADRLANEGIDNKKLVPQEFYTWLQRYAE